MMASMIDLHCHVLPGIDDGPGNLDEAADLARASVASGFGTVVATPHVSWRYPNEHETIATSLEQLRARLREDGVNLNLQPGAEIALTRLVDLGAAQLGSLGLGGGKWLLVEPPLSASVVGVEDVLLDLPREEHPILLAHPERCPAFHRDPAQLEALVRKGFLTSVTAGALGGRFGRKVQRFACELLDAEMVHNVASDAHDLDRRAPDIVPDLRAAGAEPLLEWLTESVPAAILAGADAIPPRPPVQVALNGARRKRGFWSRALKRAW